MTRFRILPYKPGSKSAKALAEELGGKVLKLEGSKYVYQDGDCLINWGNGDTGFFTNIQNLGCMVKHVSNKLNFFNKMKEHCPDVIPKFWTSQESIPDSAFPVVCRTILNGHSGAGIVIADNRSALVSAPLYVQYIKKKEEYRVHCGSNSLGEVVIIAAQRKARRSDCENPDWRIRNLDNGFVYVREGFSLPTSCSEVACKAFRNTGLDFGAVDVIWNENLGKAYVLEINTAPGLEGQTVKDYASFFRSIL